MKIIYKCEICGSEYLTKKEALECESKGIPNPLVNIGDYIYFRDCKESPILHDVNINNFEWDDAIYNAVLKMSYLIGKLYKYRVLDIKIDGHKIQYFLGDYDLDREDNIAQYAVIKLDNNYDKFHYPTIYGNNMMQLILNLYNQDKIKGE